MDWGLAFAIGIVIGAVINTIGIYKYASKQADEHLELNRTLAWDACDSWKEECERLREALKKLSCNCVSNCDWENDDVCPSWIARAALKGDE